MVWEGSLGKTFAACEWIKLRPHLKAIVVCPKLVKEKWIRELKEEGSIADVITRDEVKRIDLDQYGLLVLDEAADFASPLFIKGRSKRSEVIYKWVKSHPDAPILLLTGTPIRSQSWNIHTLACYLGIFWNVKEFRDKFFYLSNMFGRYHWEQKKGWQVMIRPYIEKISDICLMSDCVDVPKQYNQTIEIEWTKKQEEELQKKLEEDSEASWHTRHRMENKKEKFKALEEILNKYRKVIVVCYYREQIEEYIKWIGDKRQVFVLHGGIKEQDKVIMEAYNSDDCIFIVQASMSAGFNADAFSVVVFCSMSHKYVDYAQMRWRVKRMYNLHENTFIHLIGGKCDRAVLKCIEDGKDFDVHEYITRSSTDTQ